jgi:hypothetical protein
VSLEEQGAIARVGSALVLDLPVYLGAAAGEVAMLLAALGDTGALGVRAPSPRNIRVALRTTPMFSVLSFEERSSVAGAASRWRTFDFGPWGNPHRSLTCVQAPRLTWLGPVQVDVQDQRPAGHERGEAVTYHPICVASSDASDRRFGVRPCPGMSGIFIADSLGLSP